MCIRDRDVFLYEITNKNQLTLTVSDFGATWVHMLVPDREGNRRDVVLGYDSAEGYYCYLKKASKCSIISLENLRCSIILLF